MTTIKTYKAKSSVARWAKKEIGADWKEAGTIEENEDGMFFFAPVAMSEEAAEEVTPVKTTQRLLKERNQTAEGAQKEVEEVSELECDNVSTIAKPCNVVWEIAIEMNDDPAYGDGGPARKDVIAECVKRGVAFNTARTQYQAWFKASKGS